jgi:hypothetical protein
VKQPTTAQGWGHNRRKRKSWQHTSNPAALLPEPLRARLHALTRKVTMSDEDLNSIVNNEFIQSDWNTMPRITATEILYDLRDRYEERGKYEVYLTGNPGVCSVICRQSSIKSIVTATFTE